MPQFFSKSPQFDAALKVGGFSLWAVVCGTLDAAPNLFPVEDFPFSSWQLPPPDPAVKVPAGLPAHYPMAA
jgi:hypothetical protein